MQVRILVGMPFEQQFLEVPSSPLKAPDLSAIELNAKLGQDVRNNLWGFSSNGRCRMRAGTLVATAFRIIHVRTVVRPGGGTEVLSKAILAR